MLASDDDGTGLRESLLSLLIIMIFEWGCFLPIPRMHLPSFSVFFFFYKTIELQQMISSCYIIALENSFLPKRTENKAMLVFRTRAENNAFQNSLNSDFAKFLKDWKLFGA